jgi:hypothetical protein
MRKTLFSDAAPAALAYRTYWNGVSRYRVRTPNR